MQLEVYGDTLCALVSATALASAGNQVFLHLPEGNVAQQLAQGDCPFREPGLADLMAEQSQAGRLVLSSLESPPHQQSTVVWLALSPDALELAVQIVAMLPTHRAERWLVVNQSTFPVGTSESLQRALVENTTESETGSAVVSLVG